MSYFLKTRSNVVLTYISYPLRKLNNANCRRELSSLLTGDKRTQAINNLSRNGFFPWSEVSFYNASRKKEQFIILTKFALPTYSVPHYCYSCVCVLGSDK